MTIPAFLEPTIEPQYDAWAWQNYQKFVDWVNSLVKGRQIEQADADDILRRFPNPRPASPASWEDDGEEVYLKDSPDPGPLANHPNLGWIDEALANELRLPPPRLRRLLQIKDDDALEDIQENALRILGRCNNPRDWKRNRQGLVYGMVQSGKTASMIELIMLAHAARYRLFIILAGDKTSLRDQTQHRMNKSFELQNGVNIGSKIHSPTWYRDFRQASQSYTASFRYNDRRSRGEEWTTIIVVKKQLDHLEELIEQIESLKTEMIADGEDFGSALPALILDDEGDYASQNTDVRGEGNPMHNEIVRLREALPRNTYVGYTATPQACLAADPASTVGYPRDFFWLLEPYMDRSNGVSRPRSYLGAYEVFWDYDDLLIHEIGRDEWPHHEKDSKGNYAGVYLPPRPPATVGKLVDGRLLEVEHGFLEDVLAGERPEPPVIRSALIDFVISCGIRWWRFWQKERRDEKPSITEIVRAYPEHAAMIHLSLSQGNQELIRDMVQRQWDEVARTARKFDPRKTRSDAEFREGWRLQSERTQRLFGVPLPPFEDVHYFMLKCLDIAGRPINDYRQKPYRPYDGSPFVYILNSSGIGNELFYGQDVDAPIRTKKAAIIVGGNILSRGLTIEGLAVTVFGRTAKLPLGDALLQMGRWFGHHMASIDLVSIFMQEEVRETMRQLAEADKNLRLQIKDAILHDHPPTQVLLEMRNSPFYRITSPSKSVYLKSEGGGIGFGGRQALLTEPWFDLANIRHNITVLNRFETGRKFEIAHNRARLYRNVPPVDVIRLLNELHCSLDAAQTSFKIYADYLDEWNEDKERNLAPFPAVNVAVFTDSPQQRQRLTAPLRITDPVEARKKVTKTFGSIVGGSTPGGYRGDAFLDKSPKWHGAAEKTPSRARGPGDDILIVFYPLDPNYVRKGAVLQPGDEHYVDLKNLPPKDRAVLTYAAWTPAGGRVYDVVQNVNIKGTILQRGREQIEQEEET